MAGLAGLAQFMANDPSMVQGLAMLRGQNPNQALVEAQQINLNNAKMQEMQRAQQAQESLRAAFAKNKGNITPEMIQELWQVDPDMAMKLTEYASKQQKQAQLEALLVDPAADPVADPAVNPSVDPASPIAPVVNNGSMPDTAAIEARINKLSKAAVLNPELKPLLDAEQEKLKRVAEKQKEDKKFQFDTDKEDFDRENALRDEFTKNITPLRETIAGYRKAKKLVDQDNVAGDTGLINVYARILSPGIVTENDFLRAVESGGLPEQFKAYMDQISGKGRLTPAQRKEIEGAIRSMSTSAADEYKTQTDYYTGLAKQYKGVKPERVISKFGFDKDIEELLGNQNVEVPAPLAAKGITSEKLAEYKKLKGLQ